MVEETQPDVVTMDIHMPKMDGYTAVAKIKSEMDPAPLVLMLTAKGTEDDVMEGLMGGADDYITKPFYPHELEVRLSSGKRVVELNQKLLEARNALEEQATHDALTGLWNRPAIMNHLVGEMDRSHREGKGQCVCLMDIDKFKNFNDFDVCFDNTSLIDVIIGKNGSAKVWV